MLLVFVVHLVDHLRGSSLGEHVSSSHAFHSIASVLHRVLQIMTTFAGKLHIVIKFTVFLLNYFLVSIAISAFETTYCDGVQSFAHANILAKLIQTFIFDLSPDLHSNLFHDLASFFDCSIVSHVSPLRVQINKIVVEISLNSSVKAHP